MSCGAPLPEVPSLEVPSPEAPSLGDGRGEDSEYELGGGFRAVLKEGHLEWWGSGGRRLSLAWGELVAVRFVRRPVYEALAFVAAALVFSVFMDAVVSRLALTVIAALAASACALRRRFALKLRLSSGKKVALPLGLARAGSLADLERRKGWEALWPALKARGVGGA